MNYERPDRALQIGDRIAHINDPRKVGTVVEIEPEAVAEWPHLELGTYREPVLVADATRLVTGEPVFHEGDRVESVTAGTKGTVTHVEKAREGGFVWVLYESSVRPRREYSTAIRPV
ncbi:hypothetical protein AXK58_24240 [Tsukamurella tyrosinosolvens]|uniref:Uncharacterized protein n=1 Tax=Tsukamurella tyrosinosolvens TaxID=57704 RepID=A0A1H4UMD9_TSUTY|nr:hypothetical protein AXK58_24240 [Tsukamurella tyrosinosolvens]SEC69865.1 hypothetical protein SAMN04489793_2951 [Tsukamurella tyrosinosolvens]